MNHDDAKKSNTAEAYILDDLNPNERDAFEEHFFDCTDCTADVRDAAKVADGVRTGIRVVPVKHYSRWAAAAAGAAVAIGLAYQYVPQVAGFRHGVSNPPGQAARVTAGEQPIELDASRGADAAHIIRPDQPVSLYFVIPPPETPPLFYSCNLIDDTGRLIRSQRVMEKEAEDPVRMALAAGVLHPGHYTLEIRGGDPEIPAYHFAVEVQ
jgi:hypothetical protein